LITVFLASTFHISALFFLPAYFLARIKLRKVTISILGILTLILFTFRFQIMNLVVSSIFEIYSIVQTGVYEWLTFTLIIFIGSKLFYPTNKSETHNKIGRASCRERDSMLDYYSSFNRNSNMN